MKKIFLAVVLLLSSCSALTVTGDNGNYCEAYCYFRGANDGKARELIRESASEKSIAWARLNANCKKLDRSGKEAELQALNPKFSAGTGEQQEFFVATPASACHVY